MLQRKLINYFFLGGLLMLVIGACLILLPVQPVEAQCGSQASSCKNCHEVQGEFSVNSDGTGWHESHAFGDFCYICHAGNQQATEIDAAHAGMVPPLSDAKASCQMCHADDLDERAQVYATILNISLDTGSSDSGSDAPPDDPSGDDFWSSEPVATSVPAATPVTETEVQTVSLPSVSSELIVDDASFVDYVQRYNEIVLGERPLNWGNIILVGLIAAIVLGGGGFVILNEVRINTALGETRKAEGEYPADVIEMLPALSALKAQTRRTLKRILANPQKSDKVLSLVENVISNEEKENPAS